MAKRDYYEVLGINKSSSKDEIKKGSFQLELGTKDDFTNGGAIFNNRIKL